MFSVPVVKTLKRIITQSNNWINANAFSPPCVERNSFPSSVFMSGLRTLMHAAGSARALVDDISEMIRSISWLAVVVTVVIARGLDIGIVICKSGSVKQEAPVSRPPGSIPERNQKRAEDQGDDNNLRGGG